MYRFLLIGEQFFMIWTNQMKMKTSKIVRMFNSRIKNVPYKYVFINHY
jgi:hypothetical protein